jgi:hypothetical protein
MVQEDADAPHTLGLLRAGCERPDRRRANSAGMKAQRPNLRILRKTRFEKLMTMDEVVLKLFG